MTVKMIIASDKMFGIGKDNNLPWDCPEDLNYFKEKTLNGCVVMGRKTYESLPFENGLPKRSNYVVTSQGLADTTDFELIFNKNSCMVMMCGIERIKGWISLPTWDDDVWVIGGASIYRQLLPHVEEIHHTLIDGDYDCDTFFNMDFLEDWQLVGGKDLSDKAVVTIYRKS